MALPASFLQLVEQHGCFSGCYGGDLEARVCLDGTRPLEPIAVISCQDCLSFKLGVLRALLPPGTSATALGTLVTQHLRTQRGYSLSLGGYHASGPGFWLSAAYLARPGLFLLDGSRSRSLGSDLDLLLLAFKHGVATPADPQMLDAKQYATQVVHVNCAAPAGPVTGLKAFLASPYCSLQPKPGFQRVTLAEFQPAARAAAAPAPAPVKVSIAATVKGLKLGSVCPVCHAEVRHRPLLNGTYVGCLC